MRSALLSFRAFLSSSEVFKCGLHFVRSALSFRWFFGMFSSATSKNARLFCPAPRPHSAAQCFRRVVHERRPTVAVAPARYRDLRHEHAQLQGPQSEGAGGANARLFCPAPRPHSCCPILQAHRTGAPTDRCRCARTILRPAPRARTTAQGPRGKGSAAGKREAVFSSAQTSLATAAQCFRPNWTKSSHFFPYRRTTGPPPLPRVGGPPKLRARA